MILLQEHTMTDDLKTENELEKEEKDEYHRENQKNENIAEKYEENKEENSKSDDVHPESESYVKAKEENIDEPKIDMPEEPEKENGNKEVTEEDGIVRPERENSQKGEVTLEPEINPENKMVTPPEQSEKEKGQFENKEESNEDEQKKEEVLEPVIEEEKEKHADVGETQQNEGTVVVKGNLVGEFVNVDEAQPEHNGVKKQVRFDLINEDMNSNHFGINVSVADVVNKVFLVEDSGKHKIDDIYKNFPSSQISGQKFFEDLEKKEKEKETYQVETEDISDVENTDGALAVEEKKRNLMRLKLVMKVQKLKKSAKIMYVILKKNKKRNLTWLKLVMKVKKLKKSVKMKVRKKEKTKDLRRMRIYVYLKKRRVTKNQ